MFFASTLIVLWRAGLDVLICSTAGIRVKPLLSKAIKVYVFGGNDIEQAPHPWGEVFDSIKSEWEPLKPPPKESYLDKNTKIYSPPVSCGGPRKEKKIVFAETRFIYHVSSQTWEELPSPKHCLFGGVTS